MTTALARRTPTAVAAPAIQDDASFMEMVDMGDHLVRTGFLPEHIKTGAQAAAIVMAGRELGMPTMRSLRSLVLVKGKVQEFADSQLSRFKLDGGKAKWLELTNERATLWLRHPNGDEHEETFTMADAQRAGIKNHMYEKHPKPMLRSRTITAGLKSIGWEGGAGIYDPSEDLDDVNDAPVRSEPAPLPPRQAITEELRLPGAKTNFNGYGGQLLTACPDNVLSGFVAWGLEDAKRSQKYHLELAAADEILLRRAASADAGTVDAEVVEDAA